jgi:hypothetical protein
MIDAEHDDRVAHPVEQRGREQAREPVGVRRGQGGKRGRSWFFHTASMGKAARAAYRGFQPAL